MVEEKASPKASRCILRISIADMMALHVRTRSENGIERPERLYQWLPSRAMSLMATIPFGNFAVSIPHHPDVSDLGDGYPISESPSASADGITIRYARQSNSRYEAEKIKFQGQAHELAGFCKIARQLVEEHEGRLKVSPGRYAYFVPAGKLWGVILRDNGYIALDPSTVPSEINPKLLDSRADNGHLTARAPICGGDKQTSGDALPVFQHIELTLDPHPSLQSAWTTFDDYQRARAIRAQLPDRLLGDFREWLQRLTDESGFERWIFRPGMLFGDRIEWWGDCNRRRTEHEGLDFAEGLSPDAAIRNIPEGAPARAITDGEIVACLDDFLGKTVVVRHSSIIDRYGDVFHTFYSHIQPEILPPGQVAKGDLLGCVGKSKDSSAPAHFHLTGAWIPQSIPSDQIRMEHIDPAFVPVILVNFNKLLPMNIKSVPGYTVPARDSITRYRF
jgi:hypothetical protein